MAKIKNTNLFFSKNPRKKNCFFEKEKLYFCHMSPCVCAESKTERHLTPDVLYSLFFKKNVQLKAYFKRQFQPPYLLDMCVPALLL